MKKIVFVGFAFLLLICSATVNADGRVYPPYGRIESAKIVSVGGLFRFCFQFYDQDYPYYIASTNKGYVTRPLNTTGAYAYGFKLFMYHGEEMLFKVVEGSLNTTLRPREWLNLTLQAPDVPENQSGSYGLCIGFTMIFPNDAYNKTYNDYCVFGIEVVPLENNDEVTTGIVEGKEEWWFSMLKIAGCVTVAVIFGYWVIKRIRSKEILVCIKS